MPALRDRLRDPVLWTDVSQLVKTVAAAVIAWVLAREVFGLSQSFLAPWAALLTVHATVYRTLARGVQQIAAAVLGVVLASAAGALLGVNWVSLALLLLLAMIAGSSRALRAESTTAAATGLVVLLAGYSEDGSMLVDRLLDTFVGIAVGLIVNLVVHPPLRDRSAARRIDKVDDRLGELLSRMAADLRGDEEPDVEQWVESTRDIDHDIDDAWGVLRQARESGFLNIRRGAARRVAASDEKGDLLTRLEQAVAETRSMARTVGRAGRAGFPPAWVDLLARLGEAVSAADSRAIAAVAADVEAAGEPLRPVHGALLVNLRNIAESLDVVADAQPVRVAA
jgi:uncharacterized membrane protein YccC